MGTAPSCELEWQVLGLTYVSIELVTSTWLLLLIEVDNK